MKKPKPKKKEYLDYHQCAKYIAHKLKIKDLRDVDGKFLTKNQKKSDQIEYKDFWHFLCDYNEVSNPCFVHMPWLGDEEVEEWQLKIMKAFDKEFGEGTEFWVCW